MTHRRHHPESVAGCFGCHVSTLGYQSHQSRAGGRRADPTRAVPVIADDGPRRGEAVGHHTEHWDDRQDATVKAPLVRLTARTTEDT